MSRLVKLAPLQAPLRHVKQPAHNADFFRLRISKIPANHTNPHTSNNQRTEKKRFPCAGYWMCGNLIWQVMVFVLEQ